MEMEMKNTNIPLAAGCGGTGMTNPSWIPPKGYRKIGFGELEKKKESDGSKQQQENNELELRGRTEGEK
jgi:hypothetical protein